MFQIDEKVLSDSRTLVTIQPNKDRIDPITKNGTINYTSSDNNLWLTTPKIRKSYIAKEDYKKQFDRILLARDGERIEGSFEFEDAIKFNDNLEVKKDLRVLGNLTVEGNYTSIDSTSLSIEDNIIEINRNEEGSGITLGKSGFAINRGSRKFARMLFDETSKSFVLDTNENMDANIDTNSWIISGYSEATGEYAAGELRARYRLSAPHLKATESLTVNNQATLNNLTVAGTSRFQGKITSADIEINGLSTFNGPSIYNGTITANKAASFKDNVNIDKILTVKETSTFQKLSTFYEGIRITTGGANITGSTNLTGALNVTENTTLSKNLDVKSKTTTASLEVTGTTKTARLEVSSECLVNGTANVTGNLNVSGLSTLSSLVVNDNLRINSASTFYNNITVANKNVIISSDADNNGLLTVGGHAVFNKNISVKKNATFEGEVTLSNGSIALPNGTITAKNIITKNNVSIEIGDDKGIRFWNSDAYKIYMSSSTAGGRLDQTSDYNMYFKMDSGATGVNRGFVFKNDGNILMQVEGSGQVRTRGKIISNGYDVITRANEGHKTDTSGINADKLDGLHETSFLRRDKDSTMPYNIEFTAAGKGIKFSGGGSIYKDQSVIIKTNSDVRIKTESNADLLIVKDHATDGIMYKTNKVWHKGNQGHGSGLDADTLDGKQKDFFAEATHLHDDRYVRNDEVNLRGKYQIMYNQEFDSLDFVYIGDTP